MLSWENWIPNAMFVNLVLRVRFSSGKHQEHGLWPLPRQEVRKSWNSGSSTHAQKFKTKVVVNGYKDGPSLRLRINWKWSESVLPQSRHQSLGSTQGSGKLYLGEHAPWGSYSQNWLVEPYCACSLLVLT